MTSATIVQIAILHICLASVVSALLNPAELVKEHGYEGETHTVQTRDGYLLEMFRIWKQDVQRPRGRTPVIVMPGLACNAAIWVLLGPGRALGYLLADKGYDVWLGSYRGNIYARNHVKFSPDHGTEFWDFSFEEVGHYDVPAMIDRILEVTMRTELLYIGHSMGSSSLMVLASFEPHYMSKVSRAYLMAPAVFLGRSSSALVNGTVGMVVPILHFGGWGPWGTGEIALRTLGWRIAFKTICTSFASLCSFVEGMYAGKGTKQRNGAGWSSWTDYIPDSMSIKGVKHLQQLTVSHEPVFRGFDYRDRNSEIYGEPEPPSYDLSRTTCPVSMYYGRNDHLVRSEDVLEVAKNFKNVRPPYAVPYEGFNHADFFLGEDTKELLYDRILKDMEEDESNPYLSSSSHSPSSHNNVLKFLQTALLVALLRNVVLL